MSTSHITRSRHHGWDRYTYIEPSSTPDTMYDSGSEQLDGITVRAAVFDGVASSGDNHDHLR